MISKKLCSLSRAGIGDRCFQVKNTLVDKRMISKKLCMLEAYGSFLITYVEYINGKNVKGTSTSHHLDFMMRATFLILSALIGTTLGM